MRAPTTQVVCSHRGQDSSFYVVCWGGEGGERCHPTKINRDLMSDWNTVTLIEEERECSLFRLNLLPLLTNSLPLRYYTPRLASC